jgi:sugar fermentation stimulation protein A
VIHISLGVEPVECIIIKRLNRFTVKTILDQKEVLVHITNTGRLKEFLVHGRRGYCYRINGPKLKYRLFAIEDQGYGALIDTSMQEKIFEFMVKNNMIPWLKNCVLAKRNPRLDNEVIDYLIACDHEKAYVELKSAVLRVDEVYAGYPDCPTIRGRRQIKALIKHVENNGRAFIVFVAALPGVKGFKPYSEGDHMVAELLKEASIKGVVLKAVNLYYSPDTREVIVENTDLPIIL